MWGGGNGTVGLGDLLTASDAFSLCHPHNLFLSASFIGPFVVAITQCMLDYFIAYGSPLWKKDA